MSHVRLSHGNSLLLVLVERLAGRSDDLWLDEDLVVGDALVGHSAAVVVQVGVHVLSVVLLLSRKGTWNHVHGLSLLLFAQIALKALEVLLLTVLLILLLLV